jgi:hypothetical protein
MKKQKKVDFSNINMNNPNFILKHCLNEASRNSFNRHKFPVTFGQQLLLETKNVITDDVISSIKQFGGFKRDTLKTKISVNSNYVKKDLIDWDAMAIALLRKQQYYNKIKIKTSCLIDFNWKFLRVLFASISPEVKLDFLMESRSFHKKVRLSLDRLLNDLE